eukprot:6352987-Amphidinium_carterae.1
MATDMKHRLHGAELSRAHLTLGNLADLCEELAIPVVYFQAHLREVIMRGKACTLRNTAVEKTATHPLSTFKERKQMAAYSDLHMEATAQENNSSLKLLISQKARLGVRSAG